MIAIRSQKNFAVARSCVMYRYVKPNSCLRFSMSSRIFALTLMSSIETGSSATSSTGFRMMARAITARCFWPPERSDGYLSMNCSAGARPTVSRASATRRRRSSPLAVRWISSGWLTDCSIVIAGLSDA
jgi:hypothetical protein